MRTTPRPAGVEGTKWARARRGGTHRALSLAQGDNPVLTSHLRPLWACAQSKARCKQPSRRCHSHDGRRHQRKLRLHVVNFNVARSPAPSLSPGRFATVDATTCAHTPFPCQTSRSLHDARFFFLVSRRSVIVSHFLLYYVPVEPIGMQLPGSSASYLLAARSATSHHGTQLLVFFPRAHVQALPPLLLGWWKTKEVGERERDGKKNCQARLSEQREQRIPTSSLADICPLIRAIPLQLPASDRRKGRESGEHTHVTNWGREKSQASRAIEGEQRRDDDAARRRARHLRRQCFAERQLPWSNMRRG